jgi:hypothetical protein
MCEELPVILVKRVADTKRKIVENVGLRSWVARWFVFKPKILIWVNFGWFFNRRCWSI